MALVQQENTNLRSRIKTTDKRVDYAQGQTTE